jgi:hypothetical protein
LRVSERGRRCRRCAQASRRSSEKVATTPQARDPNEVVYPDTAVRIVGRDERIFRTLVAELGIKTRTKASNEVYLYSDVQRIQAELRERAAAWCRGERARAW